MWVRGLKHRKQIKYKDYEVAPYVGAWIETFFVRSQQMTVTSHPMWVRGLKLMYLLTSLRIALVAPYVGAWIETNTEVGSVSRLTSHPMWVRGLKLLHLLMKRKKDSRTLCGCVD